LYIPQIEGQQDTKENVSFGMSIAQQGKWDQFWGNAYLGSRLDTSVGALSLSNQMATTGLLKKDSVSLSQEDWKNSEWYRDKLPYSPGMTSYRASVMSQQYDKIQYQKYMNSQSKGVGRGILKFAGRLTGQLVDPINYIPFLGTGAKVLKMTPAAFTKQLALHPFTQPFLTSKALRGATEGFIASSLVQPFLNESARQIGETRTVGQGLADVMFGTAFSGVLSSIIPSNYDYFKSEYGKVIKQTSDLYSQKFDTFEKLKAISDIENIDKEIAFFKGRPTVEPENISKFLSSKSDSLEVLNREISSKYKKLSRFTGDDPAKVKKVTSLLKEKDVIEKEILRIQQTKTKTVKSDISDSAQNKIYELQNENKKIVEKVSSAGFDINSRVPMYLINDQIRYENNINLIQNLPTNNKPLSQGSKLTESTSYKNIQKLKQKKIKIEESIKSLAPKRRTATSSEIVKLQVDLSNLEQKKKFIQYRRPIAGESYQNKINILSLKKNDIFKKLGIAQNDTNKLLKSLRSENKVIDDSIETLTKDITSFPQSTQINATKSLSAAVDSIIDGRMADVGEGGLSAMSDMMKKYGIKESPVSKRLAEFEKEVILKPVEKNPLGVPKEPVLIIDEPVISKKETSVLDQNDMVELQKIDSDIAISQKMDEIMTQANNCLIGRV